MDNEETTNYEEGTNEKKVIDVKKIMEDKRVVIGVVVVALLLILIIVLAFSGKSKDDEVDEPVSEDQKVVVRKALPDIEVAFPNGDEQLGLSSTYEIKWKCNDDVGVVDIFAVHQDTGEWVQIGSLVDCAEEKYVWKVEDIEVGEYKITINHIAGSQDVIGESDYSFSVVERFEEK